MKLTSAMTLSFTRVALGCGEAAPEPIHHEWLNRQSWSYLREYGGSIRACSIGRLQHQLQQLQTFPDKDRYSLRSFAMTCNGLADRVNR
jgi:hypothetical protein